MKHMFEYVAEFARIWDIYQSGYVMNINIKPDTWVPWGQKPKKSRVFILMLKITGKDHQVGGIHMNLRHLKGLYPEGKGRNQLSYQSINQTHCLFLSEYSGNVLILLLIVLVSEFLITGLF